MEKKKWIAVWCILAVLVVGMGASITLSAVMFNKVSGLKTSVDSTLAKDEDVAQEDDVVIADEYTIKSTKNISDAYKEGKEDSLNKEDKDTLDMAKKVLDEIITDGMSDYEKELAVYDWMVKNIKNDTGMMSVIPTSGQNAATPNGVLKSKTAVCVGYATTFRLFMQMMDIECKIVHTTDRIHSWDEVKLDGEWYHTDIYSDAGSPNYSHFNMNDKECSDGYEWNTDFFPAATGTKYNYAVMNNEKLDDVYKLPKKIKKAIEDKKYFLAYNLGQDVDDEKVSIINAIVQSISNYVTDSYYLSAKLIDADNGDKVMAVYISSYNDTSAMDNLSDKITEKINRAVDKAFSDFSGMTGMEDGDLGDITSSSGNMDSSDEAIEDESLNEEGSNENLNGESEAADVEETEAE